MPKLTLEDVYYMQNNPAKMLEFLNNLSEGGGADTSALESKISTLEGKITTLEGKVTTLEGTVAELTK